MAAVGTKWSAEERAANERDTIQLLRRGSAVGEQPCKKMKIAADAEHLASFDFMAACFDVLRLMTKEGFDGWHMEGPLPHDRVPRSLWWTMDWEQKQWRVMWFLRHLGVQVEGIQEPVHRRNNDLGLGIIEAGYGTIRDKGFICANVHFGPHPHGGNHKDIEDTARDLSVNADPDDPELIFYWPQIMACERLPMEMDCRAGRQSWLHDLPNRKCFATRGSKASNGKWGSLQEAWGNMDDSIGAENYVLTHLAKRKKWLPNGLVDLYPASCECDALLLSSRGGPASAAPTAKANAAAAPAAAPKAKAKAKPTRKSCKSQVLTEKRKCQNALHFVLKCKFDENFVNCARQLVMATAAECAADSHFRSQVLTPEQVMEWHADQAGGAWVDVLRKILGTLRDRPALRRAGITDDEELAAKTDLDDAIVWEQDAMSHKYCNLVFSVLRHRASSNGWYHGLPGGLALLMHHDPEKVNIGLRAFQLLVESVEWCEGGCAESQALAKRSMVKSKLMAWAANQGKLVNFERVTDLFREFLADAWCVGPCQTVINENLNKFVRDQEQRGSTQRSCSRISRYHNVLFRQLLERHGCASPTIGATEASFGKYSGLDSLFEVPSVLESDLQLNQVLDPNVMDTHTAHTIKKAWAESALMQQAYEKKDRAMVAKSWRTALAPVRGVILVRRKPETHDGPVKATRAYFVLYNTGRAALCWRVRGMAEFHIHLDPAASPEYIVLPDFEEFKTLDLRGASPLRCLIQARTDERIRHIGCELLVEGAGQDILTWQRKRGFANIPEAILKRLALDRGAPELPAEAIASGDESDRVVCRLTLQDEPAISPEELTERLTKRAFLEDNVQDLEIVDQQILDDVMPLYDRQESMKRQSQAKDQRISFEKRAERVQSLIAKLTPRLGKTRPLHRDYRNIVKEIKKLKKKVAGYGVPSQIRTRRQSTF